jgi:anaerobic magnesium-protoporphyrin IX monomethyl ester cyclase
MIDQKILLIYPNERDMSLVPPVIALFSKMLKEQGHKVSLFDSTGYDFEGKADPDVEREKALYFKPTEPASYKGVKIKLTNMYDDLIKKIDEFNPTLLAISVTESTFLRGMQLLNHVRIVKKYNIPTIAGGVFPTFAPDRVLKEKSIDIVCVGEGEEPLTILCDRMQKRQDWTVIPGLWVKKPNGTIVKNRMPKAIDINSLPNLDFSIFEDDRFYRPMKGSVYRMLPIETHRGCPYTCSFCNSPAQNILYKDQTKSKFFRKKSMEKIREELINFRDTWNGEYVFFWADTFLAWTKKELEAFCEMYSEFKFPFWCQSRPETVSDKVGGYAKLKMLRDVGMHHMSFGLEHGNEKYRKEVVKRNYTNKDAIEALKNPNKLGITFTINNIIGMPDETRALAFDTIELNRQINSFNLSCSTFAPYAGTLLRSYSERKGYINKDFIAPANVDWSSLTMPNFSKKEIYGLQRTFVMYSKFPKNRWKELRKAEELSQEGDKMFNKMRDEFLETYFKEPEVSIAKVND